MRKEFGHGDLVDFKKDLEGIVISDYSHFRKKGAKNKVVKLKFKDGTKELVYLKGVFKYNYNPQDFMGVYLQYSHPLEGQKASKYILPREGELEKEEFRKNLEYTDSTPKE